MNVQTGQTLLCLIMGRGCEVTALKFCSHLPWDAWGHNAETAWCQWRVQSSRHAARAEREHSCLMFCLGSSGMIALCAPAGFSLSNGDHCHALFPLNYMSAPSRMNSAQIPTPLTAVTVVKMLPQHVRGCCSMNNEILHGLMLVSATVRGLQVILGNGLAICNLLFSCIKSMVFHKSISRVMSLSNVMSLRKGHAVHNSPFFKCCNNTSICATFSRAKLTGF